MGKITLNLQVDEATVRDLEARGIDPVRFAEAHFRDSYERAQRASFKGGACEKATDPETATRRANEWSEANRVAIAEHNDRIEERGLLTEYEPFKPRWLD